MIHQGLQKEGNLGKRSDSFHIIQFLITPFINFLKRNRHLNAGTLERIHLNFDEMELTKCYRQRKGK